VEPDDDSVIRGLDILIEIGIVVFMIVAAVLVMLAVARVLL
jgi:hypothetical protein